ncbi:MAG TPA: T9SS type A sorting domain-containing protein [bacterium]|jgi:hypothetical protein
MVIIVAILLALASLVPVWAQDAFSHPNVFPTSTGTFYHGVYPGPYNGREDQVTPAQLQTYQQTVGKPAMFVYFSHEWALTRAFPTSACAWIDSMGSIPFIRLSMRSQIGMTNQQDPVYNPQRIINGDFDADLHAWARAARSFGKAIFAQYGIEVNGGVMPWSACFNGGGTTTGYGDPTVADGPERYRDAYRHIIDICRAEGATNIYWFFHVVGYSEPHETWNNMDHYYPGDNYIDGIGVSIYGAKSMNDPNCQPFAPAMDYAYPQMAALSTTKPIWILEMGAGGNNTVCPSGTWANDAFTSLQGGRWPRVSGFSWWDEKYSTGPNPGDFADFWVQDDSGTTQSFRTWVRDRSNVLSRLPSSPPPASTVTVSAPNGGESWATGTSHAITWTSSNLSEAVKIELNRAYPGGTWETIIASTGNTGSYTWAVAGTASSAARVRITGTTHTTVGDTSNASFSLTTTAPVASVTVTAPNGGEAWGSGTSHAITWSSANFPQNVQIELNRSYPGGTWEVISSSASNTGSYQWSVNGSASSSARIRVRGTTTPAVGDTSNANFSITATSTTPTITVTSPNGGELARLQSYYTIRWGYTNVSGAQYVRIQLNRNYPTGTWESISYATYNDGSFTWAVSGATTSRARIRIVSYYNSAIGDTSDANFTISAGYIMSGPMGGTGLAGASPNPFNPTTQIQYQLSEAVHVKLEVFDIMGRLVATLMDSEQAAGTHRVTFDGSNLASGMYLMRMSAGNVTKIQKMQLLK